MTCEATTIAPTAAEARRGLYIDFEGRAGFRPALLGVYDPLAPDDAPIRQVILEPALSPAARACDLEEADLETLIEELVDQAEREGRVLIGWSSREIHAVRVYCSPEASARFEAVYRDAKKAAKAWRRARRLDLPRSTSAKGHALSRYARLIGYCPRSSLWGRRSASVIRTLGDAFARGATWERIGRGSSDHRRKARWTMMLRHNELDCRATHEVARVVTAAGRLESGEPLVVRVSRSSPRARARRSPRRR